MEIQVIHNASIVKKYINQWHSTLPAPVGWKVAFILLDDQEVIGVSTWGRPVARHEDQVNTLEHTRMALHNAPRNTASWFIAQNRKWIRENMPEIKRVISYVNLDHHTGITYRADNWITVYKKRSYSSWLNRPGRVGNEAKYRAKFEREP